MENASKALLMAAGVMVGVLLLSLAVYLFTIFGDFGSDMTAKLTQKDIDEFNAQFLKYESYQDPDTKEWKNTCRAQDVVTIANIAQENNKKYDYTTDDENSGYYYVRVIISKPKYEHFETKSLDDYIEFLKKYSGAMTEDQKFKVTYFKCTDIKFNANSKRVCSVTFEQLP